MFVDFNILNQLGSPSINSNTFANRPAAGQTGRLFVSTDTFEIYRDNGTTWDLIGGPGSSTITGTGTATQVAYFTSSQAIGSSANLFWDNTNGFLGVGTATPSARIEAVKTDGVGIYSNFTTNAGSGSSTTALWAKNITNSSGFAAVIEETTPNTTAGQYPLLIKHSLSSGTAGVGMGTGIHWQLPDDAGTFKTTQLTVETIDAAAATYATRYRFNVQSNGTGTPVAYINATGLGIFTATPSAALDIHSTGAMARLNSTSATGNSLLAFQRTGTGLWRIGDFYNGGANYFEIHNTVLNNNAVEIFGATNKSIFTALETYTTGLARGNYFDYNLSVSAGGSFSSPNAITALGASLDLTLAGSATIPSGARSGLDAYNSISFTGTGTLTHTQGTQIRAYSNLTAGWAFNGTATGTITHLAGLRALFPDNTGSAINVTNNYALLLNDQTPNTGTVTYTNRWGVYQEGASDLNYFASNVLIGTTVNAGNKLEVVGTARINFASTPDGYRNLAITYPSTFATRLTIGASNFYIENDGNPETFTFVNTTGSGIFDWKSGASATQKMRLDGNNNLGLGTSITTAISTGYTGIFVNGTNGSNIDFRSSDALYGRAQADVNGFLFAGLNSVPIKFFNNGAESVRITSGLVGIGTSAPASLLAVGGNPPSAGTISAVTSAQGVSLALSDNANSSLYVRNANGGSIIGTDPTGTIRFATNGNAAVNEVARINANGNLLIGTTTDAGQKLQVAGSVSATGRMTVNTNVTNNTAADIINTNTTNGYGLFIRGGVSGVTYALNVINAAATIDLFTVNGNGSIATAPPTGGTKGNWKLGSRVAAAVALDATQYIEVDIGGTLYKLAIVT